MTHLESASGRDAAIKRRVEEDFDRLRAEISTVLHIAADHYDRKGSSGRSGFPAGRWSGGRSDGEPGDGLVVGLVGCRAIALSRRRP